MWRRTGILALLVIGLLALMALSLGVSRISGDIHVDGVLSSTTLTIPDGTIVNADVNASADIAATKIEQQYIKTYSQESDTTAADEARVIHTVYGTTGTIVAFEVGCVVANVGESVVDFDLLNNGVSILTAAVTVDNGDAAYAIVEGTIDTATLADGDVLEVSIDATVGGGTLGKGAFASVVIQEDAQ